jgi:hypothetical protein
VLSASASTYLPYAVGSYVLQLLRVSHMGAHYFCYDVEYVDLSTLVRAYSSWDPLTGYEPILHFMRIGDAGIRGPTRLRLGS